MNDNSARDIQEGMAAFINAFSRAAFTLTHVEFTVKAQSRGTTINKTKWETIRQGDVSVSILDAPEGQTEDDVDG